MRILQLHTRYRLPGGEDSMVRVERDVLENAGHAVHQHLEHNPEDSWRAAAALAGSAWNVRAARRVAHSIDVFRPDVAHVHNTWFAASPSVLATLTRKGIPVVATVHNYRMMCANSLFLRAGKPCEACVDRSPWQAVRHRCYRDSRAMSAVAAGSIAVHRLGDTWSRHVDRFIVLSEFARGRLLRAGLPVEKLALGANFVPDPAPRPRPPSASRTVLFVGRISPEKGLDVLLEAWRRADTGDLRLDIIGDGPERARLDAPPGARFLGLLPGAEVIHRLREARALVIPSVWYEGQPVTALEGLAAGTPVVLSDIGGLPEVIGDAEAGWIVAPGSVSALAGALEQVRADDIVDRRGESARQRYQQRFTPADAVARLERAYLEAQSGSSA